MGTGEGGVIFNPEIYIADFGNFKQGFLSMKLIQNSNFRVQGKFFSTIVLRKIKTRHTLKKALVPVYGTCQGTKTDEFSEKFQGWDSEVSSSKCMLF